MLLYIRKLSKKNCPICRDLKLATVLINIITIIIAIIISLLFIIITIIIIQAVMALPSTPRF